MAKLKNTINIETGRVNNNSLYFLAISIIIAVFGLAGYFPGLRVLSSGGKEYIPMAPSTSISFIALSVILILITLKQAGSKTEVLMFLISALVTAFGFIKIIEYYITPKSSFESLFIKMGTSFADVPVGIMAAPTGLCFFLAGMGIIFVLLENSRKQPVAWHSNGAGLLGSSVIIIGATFILGYLYNTPILYNRAGVIPMALTTAIAFLFLGIGEILVVKKIYFPWSLFLGTSIRARLFRTVMPLVLSILFVVDLLNHKIDLYSHSAELSAIIMVMMLIVTAIIILKFTNAISDDLALSQKALKERETLYHIVADYTYDWEYLVDPYGKFLYIAPSCERMTGYKPEEFLSEYRLMEKLAPPEDKEKLVAHIHKIAEDIKNPDSHEIDFEILTKSGERRWISHLCQAVFDNNGNYLGRRGSNRDITERKRMEDAVVEEKERLHVTLRSIGDGVIVTDLKGAVILLNKVAENLTGWQNKEAAGRHVSEVMNMLDAKTRIKSKNPCMKAIETNTIVSIVNNTILISKDGLNRQIEDSCAPIRDKDSRIIGTVLVFRDVTEKKKIEDSLINAQKLESLGLLAGGIAHDFNNLLSVIFGYYDLIKSDLGNGNEKIKNYLNNIFDSYSRARNLTKQLLTFAKGGAPQTKTMNLAPILKRAAEFTLSGSNVKLTLDIEEGLWLCDIDVNQMEQVIDNLVINARQAMPAGGNIIITARNLGAEDVLPVLLKPGRYVKISIKDTGLGISKENIKKIFDPYFTTKASGTGLGLPTAYSIIVKHDGYIDVESESGRGTVFYIYLPASSGKEYAHMEKKEVQHIGKGKILIMDDEALILQLASTIFEKMGYEVTVATNGDEAIREYKNACEENSPFKLVMLDLTIVGGKGGVETLKVLKGIDLDVAAVAASGYSADPVLASPSKYGFKDSIVKPYLIEDLFKLMNRLG